MIYYFSGTGNSKFVCRQLAEHLQDDYSPVTNPQPFKGGALGIVFPVYAWGLPNVISLFIKEMLPRLIKGRVEYVYVVMTCGDDMGYADFLVRRALRKNGLELCSAFSLQMPNTYVSLPGFDVDTEEEAENKVEAARKTLPEIAKQILLRRKTTNVNRGVCAHLKTYVIRPLFNKFLIGDGRFHVIPSCICCGKCAEHCPIGNITMNSIDKLPRWLGNCTGCLGCYHVCPKGAIQYGWFTRGKGQYDSTRFIH